MQPQTTRSTSLTTPLASLQRLQDNPLCSKVLDLSSFNLTPQEIAAQLQVPVSDVTTALRQINQYQEDAFALNAETLRQQQVAQTRHITSELIQAWHASKNQPGPAGTTSQGNHQYLVALTGANAHLAKIAGLNQAPATDAAKLEATQQLLILFREAIHDVLFDYPDLEDRILGRLASASDTYLGARPDMVEVNATPINASPGTPLTPGAQP